MKRIVYGDEVVCPECGSFLSMNVDIDDNFLYDICGGVDGCGFKRKKRKDGQVVMIAGREVDLEQEDE